MAGPTITGKASIWGVNGELAYTGVASPAAGLIQTAKVSDKADVGELKNGVGDVVGLAITNKTREITIDFIPVGTALADAKAALKLPDIPSVVTTTGFDHADYNGTWGYYGDGETSFAADFCKMTLPLKIYAATFASTTGLTTVVS